jgi:hypothetical protein
VIQTVEGTISAEEIRRQFDLPKETRIWVRVPGGGDWSNTDLVLDVDNDTVLKFEFTQEHEE